MNVHAQTDLLKMENSASVIKFFFFAQSFGELITATLFGNITCLILKNSYNFYYFFMIMITIVITIVKPCNKADKSDNCIENDDDFANNKPVTIRKENEQI